MATNQERLEAMQAAALGLGLEDLVSSDKTNVPVSSLPDAWTKVKVGDLKDVEIGPPIPSRRSPKVEKIEPEQPTPVIAVKRPARRPQSKAAKVYYGKSKDERRERSSAVVGLFIGAIFWLIGLLGFFTLAMAVVLSSLPAYGQLIGFFLTALLYWKVSEAETHIWKRVFDRSAWQEEGPLLGLILAMAVLDYVGCFLGSHIWTVQRIEKLGLGDASNPLVLWVVPAITSIIVAFAAEPILAIAWEKYRGR